MSYRFAFQLWQQFFYALFLLCPLQNSPTTTTSHRRVISISVSRSYPLLSGWYLVCGSDVSSLARVKVMSVTLLPFFQSDLCTEQEMQNVQRWCSKIFIRNNTERTKTSCIRPAASVAWQRHHQGSAKTAGDSFCYCQRKSLIIFGILVARATKHSNTAHAIVPWTKAFQVVMGGHV